MFDIIDRQKMNDCDNCLTVDVFPPHNKLSIFQKRTFDDIILAFRNCDEHCFCFID